MKQKVKSFLFAVTSSLVGFLPMVSVYAATSIGSDATSLVICGNGVDQKSEQAAIDRILTRKDLRPEPNDPIYYDNGKFNNDKFNADVATYLSANGRSAQDQANVRADWENYENNSCQFIDIFRQIVKVINYAILAAGLYFVVRLVISGTQLVISVGDPKERAHAKSAIVNGAIGFAIVMGSYVAVNIIFQLLAIELNTTFPLNPF